MELDQFPSFAQQYCRVQSPGRAGTGLSFPSFFKESLMKTHAPSPLRWLPLAKAGMAITALCLAGHALAQATPAASAASTNGGTTAEQPRPANAAGDRAPPPHREVRRGPVKPQNYPSNPQPPLPTRR